MLMEERRILIIGTHGRFGEELVKSAEMIMGNMENIKVFSLMPEMSPEEYLKNVEDLLKTLPERTLCLTDLFGGTPCNTFAILSAKYKNEVISGLNLPMLIETYENIDILNIDELLERVLSSAKEGVKDVVKILNKK